MIPKFVIKHYAFKYKCSLDASSELHSQLEDYLKRAVAIGRLAPSPKVDEVWHNFILHTKLYYEYCINNYGLFIHHNPKLPHNTDDLISKGQHINSYHLLFEKVCDNQCNGGAKCDNQCNGTAKCDNKCNGGTWCDSTTFKPNDTVHKSECSAIEACSTSCSGTSSHIL